jgi:hypothetical protein
MRSGVWDILTGNREALCIFALPFICLAGQYPRVLKQRFGWAVRSCLGAGWKTATLTGFGSRPATFSASAANEIEDRERWPAGQRRFD